MARGRLAALCFLVMLCVLAEAHVAWAGAPRPLGARPLKRGDAGEDVRELQRRLAAAGFAPGRADGLFGDRTHDAVVAFQKARKLSPDGIVGPQTLAALSQANPKPDAAGRVAPARSSAPGVHVVRKGETLHRIAAAYGVSVPSLAEMNALINPNLIFAGQHLLIPSPGGSPARSEPAASFPGGSTGEPAPRQVSPVSAQAVQGRVAITFDDGPDPVWTPQVLDVLRRYGVRASFFFVGERVEKYPEIAARAAAEGHELGNHTYSHADLTTLDDRQVREEVERGAAVIERAARVWTRLLRPPYGACDSRVDRLVQASGHRLVLWTNVTVRDWLATGPENLASRLAAVAFDGAVLMLHDTQELTVRALPLLLAELERRGLRATTLGDLMEISATKSR